MSADSKAIRQDSVPFPPTPSASVAGRTMQESVCKRLVEPRRLPAGSPNILIVLIDDAGPRPAVHIRRRSPNPDVGSRRQRRDRVQPLPHYCYVFPHAGSNADRPESSPRRQRADCGVGERLVQGELLIRKVCKCGNDFTGSATQTRCEKCL
jgi:hypothetical protein